jgi:hypothetical protein
MRFSGVLAVVAALTVSISARPTDVDSSISTRKNCPTFCFHSRQCCGDVCVSSLRPGFKRMTHRCDSTPCFALISVCTGESREALIGSLIVGVGLRSSVATEVEANSG